MPGIDFHHASDAPTTDLREAAHARAGGPAPERLAAPRGDRQGAVPRHDGVDGTPPMFVLTPI